MKEVVFGGQGMVGSRFVELSSEQIITPSQAEVNITDIASLEAYLGKIKPQFVVNFAAITDVNACENERENKEGVVWLTNAVAPGNLAELSERLGFFFVHVSTDMVFTGAKNDPGPYAEDHPVASENELTWYGASKAAGESKAMEVSDCAVVRIIYPVGGNFPGKLEYARKIIDGFDHGKLPPMFTDQVMNITYIDELAVAMDKIISDRMSGVFHVATRDTSNPYEFASYLLEKTRQAGAAVLSASFEEFIKTRDPRRYPQFGGLDVTKTEETLGIRFSSWKEVVNLLQSDL